jgi:hypothetical protein
MLTNPPVADASGRRCRLRSLSCALFALVSVISLCGCGSVHRRMTINSDPPGALVLVDGEEKGYTPANVDFTYYGTREITLIKDGYETVTTMQKVRTPWYQVFPLDFVSDNLLPFKVTDRHRFDYQLKPQTISPSQQLIDRANELRSETRLGQ